MPEKTTIYQYRAHVVSVYDGDTLRADVDLGFFTWIRNEQFRLARLDAPEIRGAERDDGLVARDRLRELVLDRDVVIETEKKGKYGRYIAEVFLEDDSTLVNVNDVLLDEGLAQPTDY
ncbi:MAG: nuclease [Bacteroidetes bacterium]|jgi:micrococcal nuclease|nr:nuclease [Bacteroidota bacterium]